MGGRLGSLVPSRRLYIAAMTSEDANSLAKAVEKLSISTAQASQGSVPIKKVKTNKRASKSSKCKPPSSNQQALAKPTRNDPPASNTIPNPPAILAPRRSERLKQRAAAPAQQAVAAQQQTHADVIRALQNAGRHHRIPPLPRPVPEAGYLKLADEQPTVLTEPRSPTHKPLLVILDLNGTLLFRSKKSNSSKFKRRPGLQHFLAYLLANHRVMVWSSAMPLNVAAMVQALAADGLDSGGLVAVWARDTLGLSPTQYTNKVQVYKQLTWVWTDEGAPPGWDQTNTVLIDDSVEKAAGQPHNLLQVPEFDGNLAHEPACEVLGQAEGYLEALRWQVNVSAYMREKPFVCDTWQESPPVDPGS